MLAKDIAMMTIVAGLAACQSETVIRSEEMAETITFSDSLIYCVNRDNETRLASDVVGCPRGSREGVGCRLSNNTVVVLSSVAECIDRGGQAIYEFGRR
jgi:hypothetical protein